MLSAEAANPDLGEAAAIVAKLCPEPDGRIDDTAAIQCNNDDAGPACGPHCRDDGYGGSGLLPGVGVDKRNPGAFAGQEPLHCIVR
jgi:hypothetical protein